MLRQVDLSAYADPTLDELVSGEPQLDRTLFLDIIQQAGGPILELGCGYGRITIPLAQRGVADLTGLELSAPSLAHARRKAGDLPIHWVEADAREFHLGRRFAVVFAKGGVFDFMQTRADQEAMLACVREHLAPGAQFLFDICENPPGQMVNDPGEVEWFTLTHPNGRRIYVTGRDRYDFAQQLRTQTCYERWDAPGGELVRPSWELTLRYNMPQDVESVLHYNGFRVVAKYATWDGAPETADKPAGAFVCEAR